MEENKKEKEKQESTGTCFVKRVARGFFCAPFSIAMGKGG